MASIQSIAITEEEAYKSLAETTYTLASRYGVVAPDLNIHKRYPIEYRRAQELKRIADFLEEVASKLDAPQDDAMAAVADMVSQPDRNWTKAELKALVLGDDYGD